MANAVESCPTNLTETLKAATRVGCGEDKYGNNQYICIPNIDKTALVELCRDGIMGIIPRGNCLETTNGKVFPRNCSGFVMGCPETPFKSSEIFKYPACQSINKLQRCYIAQYSCPNSITTETISHQGNQTNVDISNTTDIFQSFPEDSKAIVESVIAAVVIVFLLIMLLTVLFLWKRRKKQKKKRKRQFNEGDEMDSLINGNGKNGETRIEEKVDEYVCETTIEEKDNENSEKNGIRNEGEMTIEEEVDENVRETTIEEKDNENIENNGIRNEGKTRIEEEVDENVRETTTEEKDNEYSEKNGIRNEDFLAHILGDYSVWKTDLSGCFSTLGCNRLFVLYCFLCSDSGSPDFNDPNWTDLLHEIRHMAHANAYPMTADEAKNLLEYVKSNESNLFEQEGQQITKNAADEIIYRIGNENELSTLYLSSFQTVQRYMRSSKYNRKPGEKCIINKSLHFDSLLIHRLQMDVLTHETMEDTHVADLVCQILSTPKSISIKSKDDRKQFLRDLEQNGEPIRCRRSQDSVQHVKWLWKYHRHDIVRSCIGLHPHLDIYIIDSTAYRKQSKYHNYPAPVRCLLYCLLFSEDYKLNVNDDDYKHTESKLRQRYFTEDTKSDFFKNSPDLPDEIIETQSGVLTFASDDVHHEVMYAFITECLIEDSDLEFFLKTAGIHVISEYCRSWEYKKSEGERCLYVPSKPEKMYELFITRLNSNIIKHRTLSDWGIRNSITEILSVPLEILNWDQEARERYVECAKKGTQTVHHARGMIVGCASAGKTTLIKRLLGCSEEEIKDVKSTEGLEVHEEIFEICNKSLKGSTKIEHGTVKETFEGSRNAETISIFDFGGQSVYYACHQIYLTRRAFYVVVVDASKNLGEKVGSDVCDQHNTVFSGWNYGDYFVFWIKSIHTYCATEKEGAEKPKIIIVATHWEDKNRKFKDKDALMDSLQNLLPSHLAEYIMEKNCFCIQFPIKPLTDLQERILKIAGNERWKENIPKEWAFFGIELNQRKRLEKVISTVCFTTKVPETIDIDQSDFSDTLRGKRDMLQYYHDAGKALYFNEEGLQNVIIIDVQWFIDAFKIIITDKLKFQGIPGTKKDWDEYYETGNLRDRLLTAIWQHRDTIYRKCMQSDEGHPSVDEKHSKFLISNKELLLHYMQRLGLVAVGKESHYIPCMNRRTVGSEIHNLILKSESSSSIRIYKFDFLPYFFFFRLVVACMQVKTWKVVVNDEKSCLYKNAALFASGTYIIILSVTVTSIQLQIVHTMSGQSFEVEKTRDIQRVVEDMLANITATFHQKIMFKRGIRCKENKKEPIATQISGHFLRDKDLAKGDQEQRICPLHQVENQHFINSADLIKYWELKPN